MLKSKNKISIRQLILIYITVVSSPAIRLLPSHGAVHAKQAGWLSPLIAIIPILMTVFALQSFCHSYKDHSFADIMTDIFGKIIGKILIGVYTLYTLFLACLYVRYLNERLLATIYPLVNEVVFIVSLLIVLSFVLKSGLTVIARMNEIILPIVLFVFLTSIVLLLPTVRMDYVRPLITRDWPGILKGSLASISIYSYIALLFFAGKDINNKEEISKFAFKGVIMVGVLSTLVSLICIGNLGFRIVERLPIPYIVTIKQISFLNIIEKLESTVVTVWIFSDFILIGLMAFICLYLFKSLFGLQDEKSIIHILLILIGLGSSMIAVNRYEMQLLSDKFLIPANIILFLFIPLVLFFIGKIRKKV